MEIVRSKIFSQFPELLFAISTSRGGASDGKFNLNLSFNVGDLPENVKENRRRFYAALGIPEDQIVYTQQQHTNNVVVCSSADVYPNCDSLITNTPQLYLSISAADCNPVMLYDPATKTVAGIHAGWRGTLAGIVKNTVAKMREHCNVTPADVIAFIGPSAGKCCYEVGEEVALKFSEECREKKSGAKYLLDLKRVNMIQLLENGVQESHIEVHPDCTIHNDLYHSYRRDGKASGRMHAIIGLKQ